MNNIVRVSQTIKLFLIVLALAQLGLWVGFLLFAEADKTATLFGFLNFTLDNEGPNSAGSQLINAFGFHSIVLLQIPYYGFLATLYMLLYQLFDQYQQGHIFSTRAISCIRRVGLVLLIWPLVKLFYSPLLIGFFALIGVFEHGTIAFNLSVGDVGIFASGVMIRVIGWVMYEANRLHEEQELTI